MWIERVVRVSLTRRKNAILYRHDKHGERSVECSENIKISKYIVGFYVTSKRDVIKKYNVRRIKFKLHFRVPNNALQISRWILKKYPIKSNRLITSNNSDNIFTKLRYDYWMSYFNLYWFKRTRTKFSVTGTRRSTAVSWNSSSPL